ISATLIRLGNIGATECRSGRCRNAAPGISAPARGGKPPYLFAHKNPGGGERGHHRARTGHPLFIFWTFPLGPRPGFLGYSDSRGLVLGLCRTHQWVASINRQPLRGVARECRRRELAGASSAAATIILVTAPGAVTWALALIE